MTDRTVEERCVDSVQWVNNSCLVGAPPALRRGAGAPVVSSNNRYYSIKHLSHRFVCRTDGASPIDWRTTPDRPFRRPTRWTIWCPIIFSRVTRRYGGTSCDSRHVCVCVDVNDWSDVAAPVSSQLASLPVPVWRRKRQCMKRSALLWSRGRPTWLDVPVVDAVRTSIRQRRRPRP